MPAQLSPKLSENRNEGRADPPADLDFRPTDRMGDEMTAAEHTAGPWVARSYHNRSFAVRWVARRDLNSRETEYLVNAKGRRKRFHSEAACLAAIAKATGEQA